MIFWVSKSPAGRYFLQWPIRGFAAGKGMVFVFSVLNRAYNFMPVCPYYKQSITCTTDFICSMRFVCTLSTQNLNLLY